MKTKTPKPKTPAANTRKARPTAATRPPENPPERLTRAQVKTLPEPEKDKLKAEAFTLRAKGREASGNDSLLLSQADAARLGDLIRCGMLPSDPQAPQPITRERDSELRDIARKQNEAATPDPKLHRLALKIQAAGGRDKARPADVKKFDALIEIPGKAGGFAPAFFSSLEELERTGKHRAELVTDSLFETVQGRKHTDTKRARKAGEASGKKRIAKRGDCIENHRAKFEALRKPRPDGERLSIRSAAIRLANSKELKGKFHFDSIARHFRKHPSA